MTTIVVVADDQTLPVVVSQPPIAVITQGEGPKGIPGPPGPPGPQGEPAALLDDYDPGDLTLMFDNALI